MAKTAKIVIPDPTLSRVPLKLGKNHYELCFTYGAIILAETEMRKLGQSANMLHALDFNTLDASTLVPLLFAALSTYQPEITLEQVPGLIQFREIGSIREALLAAFVAEFADPDEDSKADPLADE